MADSEHGPIRLIRGQEFDRVIANRGEPTLVPPAPLNRLRRLDGHLLAHIAAEVLKGPQRALDTRAGNLQLVGARWGQLRVFVQQGRDDPVRLRQRVEVNAARRVNQDAHQPAPGLHVPDLQPGRLKGGLDNGSNAFSCCHPWSPPLSSRNVSNRKNANKSVGTLPTQVRPTPATAWVGGPFKYSREAVFSRLRSATP